MHAEVWQTRYIYGGTPFMSKREGAKHRFCEWDMALSSRADQAMHAEVWQTRYIYGGTPFMSKREGAKHRFCEWGMALSSRADQA